MKRQWWLLAVAAGAFLLLSGCRVHMDVVTEVKEDGSGKFVVTVLLGETVRGTLREGGMVTDDPEEMQRILREEGPEGLEAKDLPDPVDTLAKSVPRGWESERISEGKSKGLRLTAEFSSLDEIRGLLAPFGDWGDEIAGRKGYDASQIGLGALTRRFSITRDGDIFRFRAKPTAKTYEGATGGTNKLKATFSIAVTLPGGVTEHNADEEDGRTLIWNIDPGTAPSLSAVSDRTAGASSSFPTVPVVAGGVAAAAALAAFWATRRRNGGSPGDDTPPDEAREDAPIPV